MGAVYRAVEEGLGRKVALKVIATELAGDGRFRERFLRESRIAASLDHPHVVPIFAAGEADGALFLAMRYVEGTDLGKLLREHGALDAAFVLPLLEQVAEALDAAHERGLVHRDVKPSNILVASSGGREHCYLGDFGLTKRTGSLSGVSATGEVVGTLDYVAPEQITGGEVGAAADLYSLACVLYECLTGQSPFPRATDVALLWAHVHDEPARASEVRPELPRALDAALARGLAKEPERRYATAGELIADAKAALGLVPAAPARPRRRLRSITSAAALLVAALAVLGLATLRGEGGLAAVAPNSVGVIDPASNRLVAAVPVGIDPGAVAAGRDVVWVANQRDETVTRIDPRTRQHGRTISVGGPPSDLAVGGASVWVALGALGEVTRIDPARDAAGRATPGLEDEGVPCGRPRAGMAFGGGYAWLLCEDGELGRIDPRTQTSVRLGLEAGLFSSEVAVVSSYTDVAYGLGSLWIVNGGTNELLEVDAATARPVRSVNTGREPSALAIGAGAVWVANLGDDTVTRVRVAGRAEPLDSETFAACDGPVDVAAAAAAVWVACSLDRAVARLDPETGEVVATIALGGTPYRLAAGAGAVWVSVR
ncbi:MAG: protein kinase domain-containing protein [Gaiellaceae bacterium]